MSSISNITATGATTDPTYGASSPSAAASSSSSSSQTSPDAATASAAAAAAQASAQPATPNPADLRLVIEDDQAAGSYVYKTINPRTGEVVQQYPREQILKLREAEDYTAGSVIKAKV